MSVHILETNHRN